MCRRGEKNHDGNMVGPLAKIEGAERGTGGEMIYILNVSCMYSQLYNMCPIGLL